MKPVAVLMSVLVAVGLTLASLAPFLGGGSGKPSAPAGPSSTLAAPADAPGAASAAVCATEASELDQAEGIAHGVDGRYLDGPGLVAAGYLRSPPVGHTIVSDDGFATYRVVPIGVCAPAGPPSPAPAGPPAP